MAHVLMKNRLRLLVSPHPTQATGKAELESSEDMVDAFPGRNRITLDGYKVYNICEFVRPLRNLKAVPHVASNLSGELFHSPCSEEGPFISRVIELHNHTASCLLSQKYPLFGREIRFLRKRLALSRIEFVKLLGETMPLSPCRKRQRKAFQTIRPFIRLLYATPHGFAKKAKELAEGIFAEIKPQETKEQIIISTCSSCPNFAAAC